MLILTLLTRAGCSIYFCLKLGEKVVISSPIMIHSTCNVWSHSPIKIHIKEAIYYRAYSGGSAILIEIPKTKFALFVLFEGQF